MSRHPRGRRNKPWPSQRGSSWGDRSFEPSGPESPIEPERHPRHLRGREIGLYYRSRQVQVAEDRKHFRMKRKPEDYVLNLKIPKLVAQKLFVNLKFISKHVAHPTNLNDEQEKEAGENKCYYYTQQIILFKKPKLPNTSSQNIAPSTSSAPDFIPIEEASPGGDYVNEPRQLSFRGAGDYKYGYEDIITGTFDQKLDDSLTKGIKINEYTSKVKELCVTRHDEYFKMLNNPKYLDFLEFRKKLPTYYKADKLLEVIKNNQIIVISGETGCGKSTQVPQIILDDAFANIKGANCKILVTQPRRIAALSLAERVAQERGEKMGKSVGYSMRLERVDCQERGSIMFCTTGILLVEMETDQALTKYSHIILDEVHERDTHIDLAMCMLKKILKKRTDLKLILMSATIDADKLCAYFDDCPMMHIEGLAYPVQDVYLEEILQMTKYQLPPPRQQGHVKKWQRKQYKQTLSIAEKDIQFRAEVGPWVESLRKKGELSKEVLSTLIDARIEDLNIDLIYNLLLVICQGPPGAVLVFLPGIGEITKLVKTMKDSNCFPSSRYDIYPLHSKLPTVDQHRIFERPPVSTKMRKVISKKKNLMLYNYYVCTENIRKIIIATNIAETSITIDDIVYVIDCGKLKYTGLNIEDHVTTLQTEWISKANLRQRRGRAGRVQPGICYHLVTSFRAEKLADRILPELQRSNLLEAVLQIKRLRLGHAEAALKLVPDAPDMSTVRRAVKHLQQLGALDDSETLTPLGWHIARLPVHPAAGKLLVLACLLGCLDRAASLAAVWSFKDPFQMVIGHEDEVKMAKQTLALGEPSDHVAMSEAILQWESISKKDRRNFAHEHFLSHHTLELLVDMKRQLGDNLKQMGFLSSGNVASSWENRNASNLSLFKAVVASALYPNIGSVKWLGVKLNGRRQHRIRIKAQTPEDGNIQIHPSSVMCVSHRPGAPPIICHNPGAAWLVYWLKQRSSDLFLIDVTLVHTLPLLFFGEMKIIANEDDKCLMSISKFKVKCIKEQANMLIELRKLLDDVLAAKITSHSGHGTTAHSSFEENVLKSVIEIITAEDEGVDYYEDDTGSDTSGCDCPN